MLRPHGLDLADQLVVLKVNLGIQAKTFADGLDGGGVRREGVGHVLAGGEMVGFIGEFTAAYVFGGGDVGTFFLHRGGYGIDQFFNCGFRTFHVEYDKSFVISHGLVIIRNVSCERYAPCGQIRCNDCHQKASLFFTLSSEQAVSCMPPLRMKCRGGAQKEKIDFWIWKESGAGKRIDAADDFIILGSHDFFTNYFPMLGSMRNSCGGRCPDSGCDDQK